LTQISQIVKGVLAALMLPKHLAVVTEDET
jgi:hypothetical protein